MSGAALVLYARVPRPGTVKTRLLPLLTPAEAAALHRALLMDSMDILRSAARAGARAIVSWSEPWDPGRDDPELSEAARGFDHMLQPAGDLGTRLAATLREVLQATAAQGTGRVVIFGSDSPTLPARRLTAALGLLRDGTEAVLGPAEDGGFYLLGASRFVPGMLEGVAWGTASAFRDARRALQSAGLAVGLLPAWYDIDRPEDLERLWRVARPGRRPARLRSARLLEELRRAGRLTFCA